MWTLYHVHQVVQPVKLRLSLTCQFPLFLTTRFGTPTTNTNSSKQSQSQVLEFVMMPHLWGAEPMALDAGNLRLWSILNMVQVKKKHVLFVPCNRKNMKKAGLIVEQVHSSNRLQEMLYIMFGICRGVNLKLFIPVICDSGSPKLSKPWG